MADLFDLKKTISKEQAIAMAKHAITDNNTLSQLLLKYSGQKDKEAQRAAFIISQINKIAPNVLQSYIYLFADSLFSTHGHSANVRCALQVLYTNEIPKEYHGKVLQRSFDLLEQAQSPPAIKALSFSVLEKLSKAYPDIISELKMLLAAQWNTASPALRARAKTFGQHPGWHW